jgi:hypothetical protein
LVPAQWVQSYTADGSIASTAVDMAAYVRMLINHGKGPKGELFSRRSFEKLIEPVAFEEATGSFYGRGLRVGEEKGRKIIWHTGGMVGFVSIILADLTNQTGAVVLINGSGSPEAIGEYALDLFSSACEGQALPPHPVIADPFRVEEADRLAGEYKLGKQQLSFQAKAGGGLVGQMAGMSFSLEKRGAKQYYAGIEKFAKFLLRFNEQNGQVTGFSYGEETWVKADSPITAAVQPIDKPDWLGARGIYRSHNPWFSTIRVIGRDGQLRLVSGDGDEQSLTEIEPGLFRISAKIDYPETVLFDTWVEGNALHARVSNCDFYRTLEV